MFDIRRTSCTNAVAKSLTLAAFLSLTCAAGFADCAMPEHWTRGWVKRIVFGSELADVAKRECVRDLPHDEMLKQRFLVITYPHGRTRWAKTFVLSSDESFAPGEPVRIDLNDCNARVQKLDASPSEK